jgi:hypothetical protein
MRKLTLTLTAAAFVLGTMAIAANAQSQLLGAKSLQKQIENATPIAPITPAACNGRTGVMGCGPGWIWSRYWHRCVPC